MEAVARKAGVSVSEAVAVALGLEAAGHAERRAVSAAAVLILEDDPEAARTALHGLGPEGEGFQVRHVRDRVAAQLLLRRNAFAAVLLPLDTPEQEAFYRAARPLAPAATRFIGVLKIEDDAQLDRLDVLGLHAVVNRPLVEAEVRDVVRSLLQERETAGVA